MATQTFTRVGIDAKFIVEFDHADNEGVGDFQEEALIIFERMVKECYDLRIDAADAEVGFVEEVTREDDGFVRLER